MRILGWRFSTRQHLCIFLFVLVGFLTVFLLSGLYAFAPAAAVADLLHAVKAPAAFVCDRGIASAESKSRLLKIGIDLDKKPRPARLVNGAHAPRAKAIRGSDLLATMPPPAVHPTMSKLIHQSWKSSEVPDLFLYFIDTWRVLYSDFVYVLWTDEDNLALVQARYPELLPAYNALPSNITRADFSRNLYMHTFGGIYADLDSEPLRRLPKIEDTTVPAAFLGGMQTFEPWALNHSIPNAWMASTAGHPFWLWPVWEALRLIPIVDTLPPESSGPEFITGPSALRNMYFAYQDSTTTFPQAAIEDEERRKRVRTEGSTRPEVHLLPPPMIYPFSWNIGDRLAGCLCSAETPSFDTELCQRVIPSGGYVISYWSHSWGTEFGKKMLQYTPWGRASRPQPGLKSPPPPLKFN